MDFSKFRKISHNKKVAKFQHPEGHVLHIAVENLSDKLKSKLKEIPNYDLGGPVSAIDKEEAAIDEEGTDISKGPAQGPIIPDQKVESKNIESKKKEESKDEGYQPYQAYQPAEQSNPSASSNYNPNREPTSLGTPLPVMNSEEDKAKAANEVHQNFQAAQADMNAQRQAKEYLAANEPEQPSAPVTNYANVPMAGAQPQAPQQLPISGPGPAQMPASQSQVPTGQTYAQGIQAQKTVAAQQGEAEKLAQKQVADLQQNNANYLNQTNGPQSQLNQNVDIHDRFRDRMQKWFSENPANADRIWENKTTGQKALSIAAMALGGWGAGLAGQENLAFKNYMDLRAKDMEAQKENIATGKSLYADNFKDFGNHVEATLMGKVFHNDAMQAQLNQIMATSKAMQAPLAAQAFSAQLDKETGMMLDMLKSFNSQNKGNQNNNESIDYGKLNQLSIMSQMKIPGAPTEQDMANITKEANTVSGVEAMRHVYNNAFQELDKKFLAGRLTPADRNAFIGTLAGTIVKKSEGRYNDEQAHSIAEAMFPQIGDWQNTRNDKLKNGHAFFDNMRAESVTANRYGVTKSKQAPKQNNFKFTPDKK